MNRLDEESELLSVYGGAQLLSRLPSWMVIPLLSAVLLEMHVIIVCRNVRDLTGIVFAVLALLRPYTYCGVVLPVLPGKLSCILDAPIPILVGMTKRPISDPERKLVIVDLDAGVFDCHEKFPMIPNSKKLEAALCAQMATILGQMHKKTNVNSSVATGAEVGLLSQDHRKFYGRIASTVRDCLSSIISSTFLENSLSTFVWDDKSSSSTKPTAVTIFVRENLLAQTHPDDLAFITAFTDTQLFSLYCVRTLRQRDVREQFQQDLVEAFNELR
jgi:hypothetical protein